jgi:dihydrofolate reductase
MDYMSITLIVALDANRGIGINNTLPWHLPEDLAHFKRTTLNHPILMGRKTFDSIGRALPKRRNIVITRNPDWQHEGVETALSLAAAIALVGDAELFIIGGAQIFTEALPYADKLIVTEIDKIFNCDTFFPPIAQKQWQEVAREEYYSTQNECNYAFVTYSKL